MCIYLCRGSKYFRVCSVWQEASAGEAPPLLSWAGGFKPSGAATQAQEEAQERRDPRSWGWTEQTCSQDICKCPLIELSSLSSVKNWFGTYLGNTRNTLHAWCPNLFRTWSAALPFNTIARRLPPPLLLPPSP